MLKNKIFWRICLTTAVFALIGAVTIYISLASELDRDAFNRAEKAYASELPMASLLAEAILSGNITEFQSKPLLTNQKRLIILRHDGIVIHDSQATGVDEDYLARPEIIKAKNQETGYARQLDSDQLQNKISLAQRIESNGVFLGYVILSGKLELENSWSNWVLDRLIFSFSAAFAVLAIVAYIFAYYFFQPIARATALAQRLSVDHHLADLGKQDITIIENSLFMMAGEIEQKVSSLDKNINLLSNLLNALKEGVIAVNAENKIIHINTAALELFSLGRSVKGKDLTDIKPLSEINALTKRTSHSQSETSLIIEVNHRILEVYATQQPEDNSETHGFLFTIQDITERTLADNIRVEFVANASHQLKTPIASIKGIVETIIDSSQMETEMREKFLIRVSNQADNLNNIVVKLLQLARLQRFHNFREDFVAIDLNRLMEEVISNQADIAEFHEISINLDSHSNSIHIMGEPESLHQAFNNIIENAVKYSRASTSITVSITIKADQSITTIKDQGIGIPKADHDRVFERFYRGSTIASKKPSGTGLGLSIAKAAIESHNGSIKLKSSTTKGSEFTVILPLRLEQHRQTQ